MCNQCAVDASPAIAEADYISSRAMDAKAVASKEDSELIIELNYLAELISINYEASDSLGRKLSPLRLESPMLAGESPKDDDWKAIYSTIAGEKIRSLQQMVQFNTDHINTIKNETRI